MTRDSVERVWMDVLISCVEEAKLDTAVSADRIAFAACGKRKLSVVSKAVQAFVCVQR